ncbi:MAG: sulfatase [Pirellulales bacterium]|nr:sulfatase [Pirellulales bacterium]
MNNTLTQKRLMRISSLCAWTICLCVFWLCGATLAAGDNSDQVSAARPNIVIILVDDLGWKDVGCYGSTYYHTPNIDSLASQGVRFTDGYAACAVCSPTRAAILTGKYPARLMLTNWLPAGRWDPRSPLREGRFLRQLPLEEITVAETLRTAGYHTGVIGKWHLGGHPFSSPAHHGFDTCIATNDHGNPGNYFYPYQGEWKVPTTNLKVRWKVFDESISLTTKDGTREKGDNPKRKGEYLTDRQTDEAIAYMRQSKDEPLFLYLSYYAVHTPLQGKPELIKKYKKIPKDQRQGKPVYGAMVECVDQNVGRIMEALRELKIDDNTIVFFTSDNGGYYNATDHTPLRGNKGSYYEGGIRVPFIVRWPGVARAGATSDYPVMCTDIYPTCAAAAGISPDASHVCDGVDLRPLLEKGTPPERDALFWHFPHYNGHPSSYPSSVIRKGPWKLIEVFDPPHRELYNLANDIGETTNLIEKHPDKAAQLLKELQQWWADVGAEMMCPNPGAAKKP